MLAVSVVPPLQTVTSEEVQLIYMSPKTIITVPTWREMFHNQQYHEYLICLAVDEAHLIEKWFVVCVCVMCVMCCVACVHGYVWCAWHVRGYVWCVCVCACHVHKNGVCAICMHVYMYSC